MKPSTTPTLEICCASLTSALHAQKGGADRIELCANLEHGGTTPSAATIKLAKQHLQIPVFVLIRPRKADFFYNNLEMSVMLEDIRLAKSLGADGIVSGALTQTGEIDLAKTQQLLKATHPLPFTFHRAFDMCENPFLALEQLITLGVPSILTSGCQPTAIAGKATIEKLVQQANNRIEIMAGSGIRPENVHLLTQIEGLDAIHASAKTTVLSQMDYKGTANMGNQNLKEEYCWQETDENLVRALKDAITSK